MFTKWLIFAAIVCIGIRFGQAQPFFRVVDSSTEKYPFGSDSVSFLANIQKWKIDKWSRGYVYAGLDSVANRIAYLYVGPKTNHTVDSVFYENKESADVKDRKVWTAINRELTYWTNHGFPFAEVTLMPQRNASGKLHLFIKKGPYIVNDTLEITSSTKLIRDDILAQALNFETGRPYSELSYSQINQRVKRLPFLALVKQPEIYFEDGLAHVQLDVKKIQENTFEGILGVLPNQAADEGVLITGFLNLNLINLFKSAKTLSLEWSRFGDNSQELDMTYSHPFLAGSPLMFDLAFGLLKQDTTFLNQSSRLVLSSFLGNNMLHFGFERVSGTLISDNIELNNDLLNIPHTSNHYFIGMSSATVNRAFRFRDKFDFQLEASFGIKNTDETYLNSDSLLYLDIKSNLLKLKATVRNQVNIYKALSISSNLKAGLIENQQIFNNEQFRLGGLKTIRGFNENQFFVSQFVLSRIELRQYFEEEAFFFLFYDQLVAQSRGEAIYPFGFGAGFNLQTKAGLLNFALALGKQRGVELAPSELKVHIGYTSRF